MLIRYGPGIGTGIEAVAHRRRVWEGRCPLLSCLHYWCKSPGKVGFLLQLLQHNVWHGPGVVVSSLQKHPSLLPSFLSSLKHSKSSDPRSPGLASLAPLLCCGRSNPPPGRSNSSSMGSNSILPTLLRSPGLPFMGKLGENLDGEVTLVSSLSGQLFPRSWVFRNLAESN